MREHTGNRRAVVIGLDGVSHSLLQDYMEMGILPRFQQMCRQGHLFPLKSSLPEVSSVAWTSFMTGVGPDSHGIFGFTEVDRRTYQFRFPNFNAIQVDPFWKRLPGRTAVFNLPQTYPASSLPGVMVSGFVAVDLEKAVYPKDLLPVLRSMGYRLDVKTGLALQDPQAFFDDLFHVLDKRLEAARALYEMEPWDLFIAVVTETDRLHHFFHHSARDGLHSHVFRKLYSKLDAFLWEMYQRAQHDGAFFITCSDHGFESIRREVYVNTYLEKLGYLEPGLSQWDQMTGKTRLFSLDPSRIYVHSPNSFARGEVTEAESQSLIEDMAGRFLELKWDGEAVVERVFRREEIYPGPLKHQGPDLYVLANPVFDMKSSLGKKAIFGTSHFQGCHTYGDAHLFLSERVEELDPAGLTIEQVPRILLRACGFSPSWEDV